MPVSTTDGAPVPVIASVQLSPQQEAALAGYVQQFREYQAKSIQAALAVRAVYEEKLYVKSGSFPEFAKEIFGVGRSRAYQLSKAGLSFAMLRDADIDPLPVSEAQLRPLDGLSVEEAKTAWQHALDAADGDAASVRMEDVELGVAKMKGHLADGAKPLPLALRQTSVAHHLGNTPAPNDELAQRHASTLRRLHTEDQAEVWRRVATTGGELGGLRLDDDGLVGTVPSSAVTEALTALSEERALPVSSPPNPASELVVSLERDLLGDAAPDGDVFGRSVLVNFETASPLIGQMLEALAAELGGVDDAREKEAMKARRRMARCRLEPEIAAWVWPVLTPSHRRSARTWFAADDAPPPCFVPARLTQPANSKPRPLDLRLPTAHTVLLAPGVDLTRADLPPAVVGGVLEHAVASPDFLFLASVSSASRIGEVEWPSNVLPVVRAAGEPKEADKRVADAEREFGDDAVLHATNAFERAEIRGVLVLDDHRDPLAEDTLSAIVEHVAAVVMRGSGTKQEVYNQILRLRSPDLRFMSAPDVRCRPWDAMHDALEGAPRPERVAVPAQLPTQP